jgi:hypothetical protein
VNRPKTGVRVNASFSPSLWPGSARNQPVFSVFGSVFGLAVFLLPHSIA